MHTTAVLCAVRYSGNKIFYSFFGVTSVIEIWGIEEGTGQRVTIFKSPTLAGIKVLLLGNRKMLD